MYRSLEAVMVVASVAPAHALSAQRDSLGRVEQGLEASAPDLPRRWPMGDSAFTLGPTALDTSGEPFPPAEELTAPTQAGWEKERLFAQFEAVDPEDHPLPRDQQQRSEAPRRPGAPPYSALYLGLRVPLPRRRLP